VSLCWILLIVAFLVVLRWAHRPKRGPGGPDDGKGCLTPAQQETFAALAASLERKDAP
jgi:hypothetical protein